MCIEYSNQKQYRRLSGLSDYEPYIKPPHDLLFSYIANDAH